MHDTLELRTHYIWAGYRGIETMAADIRAATDKPGVSFDTLVGMGLSGALVIPQLASALGVEFLLVRKDNDGSHAWREAEGTLGREWLFVDDLIDTGTTLRRVKDVVSRLSWQHTFRTTFVGAFLYNHQSMAPGSPHFFLPGHVELCEGSRG